MAVLVLVVTVLILALIWWLLRTTLAPHTGFPVASGSLPLLGHASAFSNMPALVDTFQNWSREMHFSTYEVRLPGQRVVVLDSLAHAAEVWRSTDMRPDRIGAGELFNAAMTSLWEPYRHNLVSANGDAHRRLRKLLGPGFSPTAIRRCQGVIVDMTERLLDNLSKQLGPNGSATIDHVTLAKVS